MLKRIAQTCYRNSKLFRQCAKNKPVLQTTIKRSAFFGFKQDKDKAKKQEAEDDIESMQNISHIIKQIKESNKKLPALLPPKDPRDQDKLTVAVEMDEVLLYVFYPDDFEAYLQSPLRDYDHLLEFKKHDTYLSVYKRENLDDFLNYLKDNTEAVLFCTGEKDYVDLVMSVIDPENKVFKHRIYQEGCTHVAYPEEDVYDFVKDLDRLGRDLSKTVLIDAKSFSFWASPDNALPILEFGADRVERDYELSVMIDLLEELKKEEDVRTALIKKFSIRQALQDSKML